MKIGRLLRWARTAVRVLLSLAAVPFALAAVLLLGAELWLVGEQEPERASAAPPPGAHVCRRGTALASRLLFLSRTARR